MCTVCQSMDSNADLLIQDIFKDLQTSGKSFGDIFSQKLNGGPKDLEANLKKNLAERSATSSRHQSSAKRKKSRRDESVDEDDRGEKRKKKKSHRHKEEQKETEAKSHRRRRHHSRSRSRRAEMKSKAEETQPILTPLNSPQPASAELADENKPTVAMVNEDTSAQQQPPSTSAADIQAVSMEEYLKGLKERRKDSIVAKTVEPTKLPSGLAKFVSGESLRKKPTLKTSSSAIFVPRNLTVKTVLDKGDSVDTGQPQPQDATSTSSLLTIENLQKHNEVIAETVDPGESPPSIVDSVPVEMPKWIAVASVEQSDSSSDRGESPVLPEIKSFRDPKKKVVAEEEDVDGDSVQIPLRGIKNPKKIVIGTLKAVPNVGESSGRKIVNVEDGEIPSSHDSADSSSDSDVSDMVDNNSDGEVKDDPADNPAEIPKDPKSLETSTTTTEVKEKKKPKRSKKEPVKKKERKTVAKAKAKRDRQLSSRSPAREVRRRHKSTKTHFDSFSRRHSRKRSRSRSYSSSSRSSSRLSSNRRHRDSRHSRTDRRPSGDSRRRPDRHRRSRSRTPTIRLKHNSRRSPMRSKRGSPTMEETIDKKRLYEIARANASAMLKNGTLQQLSHLTAEDLAKLRAGGKTVEELVEYCAKLQKKEQKQADANSSDEAKEKSDDDLDFTIHHPFELKPHTGPIVMNIPNFLLPKPPVPVLSDKLLTITFPVSSGTQHRSKESEWTPVVAEKPKLFSSPPHEPLALTAAPDIPLPSEMPSISTSEPLMLESSSVFASGNVFQTTNIGDVIGNRLKAVRKLQQNPNDCEALALMQMSEDQLKNWAESKMVPGAFTGSTGVQTLSVEELGPSNPRCQAWARRDQLISSKPVEGGMGMFLLQKMGWRPGEGLGKYKAGQTQPLMMDVKQDRKGLTADEELPNNSRRTAVPLVNDLAAKHPVSALMELCAKRRWGPPSFNCTETGGVGHRLYLWKVVVNGVEYCPIGSHDNKKTAKAQAAQTVLQSLGMVPRDMSLPVVIG